MAAPYPMLAEALIKEHNITLDDFLQHVNTPFYPFEVGFRRRTDPRIFEITAQAVKTINPYVCIWHSWRFAVNLNDELNHELKGAAFWQDVARRMLIIAIYDIVWETYDEWKYQSQPA